MELDIRIVSYTSDDAQTLTAEVQAEYGRRYGGDGDISPIEPEQFEPPDGLFLIGYVDAVPAVSGGWRRGGPDGEADAEIKRMYVRPQFARQGLARLMLVRIEETARDAGITRLVLETGLAQPEAIALYTSSGFDAIAPFGFYADMGDSVHFGKRLPVR